MNADLAFVRPVTVHSGIVAHRSVRPSAQMAAAGGVPALNFDCRGTADSADIDASHQQLETWCHDVINAVAELRRARLSDAPFARGGAVDVVH